MNEMMGVDATMALVDCVFEDQEGDGHGEEALSHEEDEAPVLSSSFAHPELLLESEPSVFVGSLLGAYYS